MDLDINILLVEDNPEDVAVTRRVLRHNRLDGGLAVASSGSEALETLHIRSGPARPGLILLDINLPDISGIELLKHIKADAGLASIPVVILTGSNEDQDIQKSYDLGARSYLVKPISNDAMMLVIENLFRS